MADLQSHRIVHLKLPPGAQPAAWALCRHSKDIYNTIVELIRQAASACEWDFEAKLHRRKPDHCLSPREGAALGIWDAQLTILNAKWTAEHQAAKAAWDACPKGDAPKGKTLPALGSAIAQGDLWKILLNASLLLAVAKATPDAQIAQPAQGVASAFRTLPAKMAEASVFLAQKSFVSWLANLSAWHAGRQGRAQPKMPNFLPRDVALVVSASGESIGPKLISIKKCLLWTDADHFKPLSAADRAAYAAFPIRQVAEAAIDARWAGRKKPQGMKKPSWEDLAKVVLLPQADGQVSLRIAVKIEADYPQGSFLRAAKEAFPEEWAAADAPGKREALIAKAIKQQTWAPSGQPADAPFAQNPQWVGDRFCACGLDLGLRNIVSMGWTHGEDADVFDAKALDERLDRFDRRIDRWISEHMTDEHKRLEREKLAWAEAQKGKPAQLRERFPKRDADRLRQVSRTLHSRKPLLRIRAKRARWLRDKLHQISAKVAKLAAQRQAAVVVIGKNDGWKDGVDLGKRENRRFVRLAHAELIKLIEQKLAMAGVASIVVEESYTSEASFVDGDPLKKARPLPPEPDARSRSGWGATAEEQKKKQKEQQEKQEKLNAQAVKAGVPVDRHGFRDEKNRDRFIRQTPWASRKPGQSDSKPLFGPQVLHADVNGALNILRKACPAFKWRPEVSTRAVVWRMEWAKGLAPEKTKQAARA